MPLLFKALSCFVFKSTSLSIELKFVADTAYISDYGQARKIKGEIVILPDFHIFIFKEDQFVISN